MGRIGDRGLYIVGRYHQDHVPTENDLVVCNPPYIPMPPRITLQQNLHPLANATIGTELLETVISNAPSLLAPNGKLVMIISEMALPEYEHALPAGIASVKVSSQEVPFDVGSIRDYDEHLEWLKNERGLRYYRGHYLHAVSVFEITRT
jgi:methylase of polypeptide subunit release factors